MKVLTGHLSELSIAAEIAGYSVATVAVRVQCCYSCGKGTVLLQLLGTVLLQLLGTVLLQLR